MEPLESSLIEVDQNTHFSSYIEGTTTLHQHDNNLPSCIEFDTISKKIHYQRYYKYGYLHRDEDKPASIHLYGMTEYEYSWHQNGLFHRENDNPSVMNHVSNFYSYQWHKHGKLHRENDNPAQIRIWKDGTEFLWYINGKQHRDNDNPAQIYKREGNVWCRWYKNGLLHRDNDNPAFKYEGKNHTFYRWYKNGEVHRDTASASTIEIVNDSRYYGYYKYGKQHRLNGPSYISVNLESYQICDVEFMINGERNCLSKSRYWISGLENYSPYVGLKAFNPFIGNLILRFISRMKLKYKKRKEKELLSIGTILSLDSIDQLIKYT